MKNNIVWVNCEAWQNWINQQEITLGQPMLKNDKATAMMELEDRCKFVTYAHPKVRGFDPKKRRYYLPKDLNQALTWFKKILAGHTVVLKTDNIGFKIELVLGKTTVHKGKGLTWRDACTKLLEDIFNDK